MIKQMNAVTLPPDLEHFAAEAVASGRYRDLADVVAAGVSLLQHAEAERERFLKSLEAAEAEADRDGWHSLDDVMAEAEAIIAAKHDTAA
jgi:putative addiction module CopG family antidote